jgi:hypothetical protein
VDAPAHAEPTKLENRVRIKLTNSGFAIRRLVDWLPIQTGARRGSRTLTPKGVARFKCAAYAIPPHAQKFHAGIEPGSPVVSGEQTARGYAQGLAVPLQSRLVAHPGVEPGLYFIRTAF